MRRLLSLILIAAVGAVAAPAQAAQATGSITGRLTDSGAPVAGADVAVFGPVIVHATTDADGNYRIDGLEPADYYQVLFDVGGLRQWATSRLRQAVADQFTVAEGQETVVNDSLLPRGSAAGRFVDFDGTPIEGATVNLILPGGEFGPSATTDADGFWTIDTVFASSYEVLYQYFDLGIYQNAFGKPVEPGVAIPDRVTVVANTTTTINDTAVPRGDVVVRARDALTGQPINTFSAEILPRSGSTESGSALVQGVQAGDRRVSVIADNYVPALVPVQVVGGTQTEVTVDLEPVSGFEFTVVDAQTGAPLPGVCIQLTTLTDGTIDAECDDTTDENGRLSRTFLEAGTYQVFAAPINAPGYGAQWVGHLGGTGRQLLARFFTLQPGQSKSVTIRMDRAGTITGRVLQPSGQPAVDAKVGLVQGGFPIGGGAPVVTTTDANGDYTIDFAGPYDWPLAFTLDNLQFAGQVANRHLASSVHVTSGASTTYNYRFKQGTAVSVTLNGDIEPEFFVVRNAFTGDPVGWSLDDLTQPENIALLGPQFVKFEVFTFTGTRWYGGEGFDDATIFFIPGSGSKSITLTFN